VPLDVLHREGLDEALAAVGAGGGAEADLAGLGPDDRDELSLAWHRLPPWPDTVEGLTRLRRLGPVAPCSNGNVALLTDMAAAAGLPWDAILGAEVAQAYKPQPAAYLASVAALGLEPPDVMMVAAHAGDLVAAAGCGLRTAFVPRPFEHGAGGRADAAPAGVDVEAADLVDLADRLGAP
jgi:2-haloacid dehalogenase